MFRAVGGTLGLLVAVTTAHAECRIADYDRTAPPAIRGDVENAGIQFQWASDFDRQGGLGYVWHYIQNRPNADALSFDWKKAGLKQEFVRPLPSGKTACSQYPIVDLTERDIDDDAPIVYGNNNAVQRAAIYAKRMFPNLSGSHYKSKLSSSYIDDDGRIVDFEVSFFYNISNGDIKGMSIEAPNHLYVGIADVGAYRSDKTIGSFAEAAKAQAAAFNYEALPMFASEGAASESFFAGWKNVDARALIVKGAVGNFGAGETSGGIALSKIVVFDQQKRPIAAGSVALPVTGSVQQ